MSTEICLQTHCLPHVILVKNTYFLVKKCNDIFFYVKDRNSMKIFYFVAINLYLVSLV